MSNERERASRMAMGVAIGLLVLFAIWLFVYRADQARATETGPCSTMYFEHLANGPHLTGADYVEGAPFWGVMGYYAVFDYGEEASGGYANSISFDVSDPDVVSITGCADGTVTIRAGHRHRRGSHGRATRRLV